MRYYYLTAVKWLGGIALAAASIGLLFPTATAGVDETIRNGVLFQSVPFVAFFFAVLLLFILLIVLTALRFNGKVAPRTYRPVEGTIIAGILAGVITLFQPFHFAPYKYGFAMLLGATLLFILWSHVVPASAKADLQLPRFTTVHHLIAATAGLVVGLLLFSSIVSLNVPQAPYGIRQRVWDSYDAERQAQIANTATADFNNVEIPLLIGFSLLPSILIYFAVRELANALLSPTQEQEALVQAAPGGA